MTGMLTLVETDDFFFDAEAADRVVRFIETYCELEGRPFKLEPIQKQIVRDLFGWKWRKTGLRRFSECYFEAAVGMGKSPLLAAIGLYGLIGDGQRFAQVYSLAKSYGQARVVFEQAKLFVEANDHLSARLQVLDREIRHRKSRSVWRIVSGKGPGSGCKPSMVLGDEAHEWANGKAYGQLKSRMSKRPQAMMLVATNAGEERASFCWQLREKAVAALKGTGDPGLYPIILKADDDAKTDDPAAWKSANPLMGITIKPEKIAAFCAEAMKHDEEETDFRRLYLSIWPTKGAGRWLDLKMWDAAAERGREFDRSRLVGLPLYDGIDISECDDLSAAVYVWPIDDEGIFYVDADFWITAAAAKRYEEDNGIQYSKWAAAGDITIVPDKTISEKVRRGIAQSIISKSEPYEHKADCYDRYKIDTTLAELEGEGRTCVPVAQGYSVSPGCNELERRLIEDSIAIAPNAVLRFCAENCEVMSDVKGNIYPVKPNRKGKYAGERSAKIDGIAALVTCLVEARKHAFPEKQEFMQKGFLSICKVSTSQTRQGNPSGSSTSAAPATSTR